MKKKLIILIIAILVIILVLVGVYFYGLSPVSKKSEKVNINITGTTRKIINDLAEAKLIKSKFASLIYVKLHSNIVPKAGEYELDRKYSTEEIFEIICGNNAKKETISVYFKEESSLTSYVSTISSKFGYSEEEIYKVLNDKEYLKELINKYDFLTDKILNSDIYYPLEGYLYPAKYEFYADASIKTIIEKMLDKTKNVLDNYSTSISESKYSVHDIMTIASIIEKEAKIDDDRSIVSQVIYKRLDMKMSLGMDVTTYYGVKKAMTETLTQSDLNSTNAYNTRRTDFVGLPVGPICNPLERSIKAALNPSDTDYLYFYADINGKSGQAGKLFFAKNYNEFQSLIKKYR
jgi:UPF0755 protein